MTTGGKLASAWSFFGAVRPRAPPLNKRAQICHVILINNAAVKGAASGASPVVRNCYIAGWEATLLKHGVSSPRGLKEHAFATVVKAFISWYYKFIVSLLLVDCLRGLACSPTY